MIFNCTYRKLIIFLFLVSLIRSPLFARDSSSPVVIQKLEGSLVFDGMPGEPAWEAISPFHMVMHSPVFGNEPSESTDIRVAYDDEYIYVGASFYTRDASLIQSSSKQRDATGGGSDWLGVLFDTYNDNENAVIFWTNPSGLRTDMSVANDAVTSRPDILPINTSWNTFWDVKTQVNDDGWFIEMRIPVSSLKFQVVNGEAVMGMTLIRSVPYLNEIYTYPAITNDFGQWSDIRASRAQDVVFRDLTSRKPLYVTPYVIGGVTQSNSLNEAGTAYDYARKDKLDAGLDLKYGITSNLTLDATLNTDFAQVEADDEKVNLEHFALYFEEKRQFFLERASLFDFNTGGQSTLFYSRRIGLDRDFNPVPIIGGLRLTAREGQWDAGLINMQTAASGDLTSENFGILRVKRRMINENSYTGGIVTSRLGTDGSYNEVYGLDALIRVTGNEYLKLAWGQSFETGQNNRPFSLDNAIYVVNWERRKNVGFYYGLYASGSGKDFNPGIGFLQRGDYRLFGSRLNYRWLMGEDSPILNHGPGLDLFAFFSQSHGALEFVNDRLSYQVLLKNNWMFSLDFSYRYDNLFEPFVIADDASVPVGEYYYPNMQVRITTPMTRSAWSGISAEGGRYFDGRYLSLTVTPTWSLSSSFTVSGEYQYNNVDFNQRGQHFINHIGRLKTLYMFNTKLSASAFIQYNSSESNVMSNFRFRYNPREGNDFYLVYNEGTNTNLERETLSIPRMASRTILLKYTYTFRF